MQDDVAGRRPLKTRTLVVFQKFAKWLSGKNITPNQISILSVVFSALAAVCFFMLPSSGTTESWLLPILAAVFIQCRLLCNLFDGMVAVEGGKGTPSGELFNDIPDRIADPLILVAAGYATTVFSWSESLGWFAGLLAVMTAYVRTLSVSIGAPTEFRGPMAKQHRMALMTVASLLTAIEPFLWQQGYILLIALGLVVVGCMVTIWRRARFAYIHLEQHRGH